MKKLLYLFVFVVIMSCSNDMKLAEHKGLVSKTSRVEFFDSITLNMDSCSMRGNFFIWKDEICFADVYYNRVFVFDKDNGQMLTNYFGRGASKNEIANMLYMHAIDNSNLAFYIDSSNGMYMIEDSTKIERIGNIDWGWDRPNIGNYESPSVYNIMEMSDFDMKITRVNDSILIIPLSVVGRNLGNRTSSMFEKAHTFGLLNVNTMHVDSLFGKYPAQYKNIPTNLFTFFSYALDGDKIYVNHCIDSLIYVYEYPDKLLYTIGYEVPKIDRSYTQGNNLDPVVLDKDIQHVGVNTQLMYVKETGILLRMVNSGGTYGSRFFLQAYKDDNLIAEAEVPTFSKRLGYANGIYYGVNMVPTVDEEKEVFTLYKFRIK